jgi:hypothetical protein
MHGKGAVVMRSQLSRPDILRHSGKPTKIETFLDQIGTLILLLALAAGAVVVVVWLIGLLS